LIVTFLIGTARRSLERSAGRRAERIMARATFMGGTSRTRWLIEQRSPLVQKGLGNANILNMMIYAWLTTATLEALVGIIFARHRVVRVFSEKGIDLMYNQASWSEAILDGDRLSRSRILLGRVREDRRIVSRETRKPSPSPLREQITNG
jgi:hypothetical protein